MNKRVVYVIIIVECILAVILVSFWGKIVESLNPQTIVTDLYFVDDNGKAYEDGAIVEVELTDSNISYQLKWKIAPKNATNKTVRFIANKDNTKIIVSEDGLVTFLVDTDVTITMISNDTGAKSISITLYIKHGSSGGGDI